MPFWRISRRIAQTVGSIVTKYLLDVQPGLVQVIGATRSGSTGRYLHGPRGIQAMENSAGVWTQAVQDALGTVRVETDHSGAVQAMRNGTPFHEQCGSKRM